jgi:hypothetical protein
MIPQPAAGDRDADPHLRPLEATVAGPPPGSRGRTWSDARCPSGGAVSRSYAPGPMAPSRAPPTSRPSSKRTDSSRPARGRFASARRTRKRACSTSPAGCSRCSTGTRSPGRDRRGQAALRRTADRPGHRRGARPRAGRHARPDVPAEDPSTLAWRSSTPAATRPPPERGSARRPRPSRTGCALAQPASPPRRLASRVARLHVKIHCSPCRFSK